MVATPVLFDPLAIASLIIVTVVVVNFHTVVRSHVVSGLGLDYHLQVLSLRVALVIPVIAVTSMGIMLSPYILPVGEALEALIEGAAIYSYFAMLVIYVGGPAEMIEIIRLKAPEYFSPCCKPCGRNNPACCFRTCTVLIQQILWFRTLVSFLYALAQLRNNDAIALRVVTILSLVSGMLALLQIYRASHHRTEHLQATSKFVVIKVLIALVVLQGIIIDVLYAAGVFNRYDYTTGNYNAHDRSIRAYSFVVIVESLIASFFIRRFFNVATLSKAQSQGSQRAHVPDRAHLMFTLDLINVFTTFGRPRHADLFVDPSDPNRSINASDGGIDGAEAGRSTLSPPLLDNLMDAREGRDVLA
mmetsp:Transcript_6484/g.21871  ORF Transcript_6484/g.21871 Transcript_6484/m.21871 type:complete len:359 (-) Transcript_6484:59-1135(-)